MKLYQNTMFGLRYRRWTRSEAIAYFIKGVARELKIAPNFFLKQYEKIAVRTFNKKWLKYNGKDAYFDFNGAKLPDVSNDHDKYSGLHLMGEDTFLIFCYHNDNYSKSLVDLLDPFMLDGPYGYTDDTFDVTVKKDDIVIDAGAWIGDFSAYVASKGAICYAFEPTNETFQWLCKTAMLNKEGTIYPVQKGLGSRECEMDILINNDGSAANSILSNDYMREQKAKNFVKTNILDATTKEKIVLTSLDKFVEENNLERVDFIKADIEGAERDMLRGATNVLKTFAPKLAICTYHMHDDPEVLEKIIKEANPDYKVVHIRKKLFASI
jgi:FkbM family methyltransferase